MKSITSNKPANPTQQTNQLRFAPFIKIHKTEVELSKTICKKLKISPSSIVDIVEHEGKVYFAPNAYLHKLKTDNKRSLIIDNAKLCKILAQIYSTEAAPLPFPFALVCRTSNPETIEGFKLYPLNLPSYS